MAFNRKGAIEWRLFDGETAVVEYNFTTSNYKDKYCKKLLKDKVVEESKKYNLRKEA